MCGDYPGAWCGKDSLLDLETDLDGTRVQLVAPDAQLTMCCPHQGFPGWSSDGRKIAYVERPDSDVNSNVFGIDLESGVTTQLTFEAVTFPVSGRTRTGATEGDRRGRNSRVILTASWSADGSRLAYWTFHGWKESRSRSPPRR